jgi:RNA polymerase sigma factor (sigma-70 family)
MEPRREPGEVVQLPTGPPAEEVALEELELVYAFLYARVGNRADAEDLTQQVALKAIPRLRQGSAPEAIRGYLFATARSALAGFWAVRLGLPTEELRDDVWLSGSTPLPESKAGERVERVLSLLPTNYRRVLELRFLRGYSLREVAAEMGSTIGAIKVMQLRALRAASQVARDE